MEWSDILDDAASKLNSLGIRHVVVGSCRPIDRDYIASWAEKFGTQEVWQ
jgi:phosphoribosylformimino-5-aminoimidazole carboxamide ribonucleotide (ProFAR) isomerase